MTRLNFTFQEASPLIKYSGWVEGSSSNDSLSSSYNGSFRVSFTDSATASFTFTGTAVSIFGATRANHGQYSVSIDQQQLFVASGAGVDTFNKSLWHADNLRYGEHQVVLTNLPVPQTDRKFLDLDYVSIERRIGQDGDEISQNTLDDDSPAVRYVGAWSKTTKDTANAGTLHVTSTAGSRAIMTFNGCCLELYGHYANAPYSVTLDNRPPVNMAGFDIDPTPEFQHPRTLLYLVDGLVNGNHTVTLTNTNSHANRPFFFDYAVISDKKDTSPNGNSQSGKGGARPNSTSSKAKTPIGAIVGGVVGAVTLLALLILTFLMMRRRRRHRAERQHVDLLSESELEPKPYNPHEHLPVQNIDPAAGPQLHSASPVAYLPPSKRHQMATYYQAQPSASDDLNSRGQSSGGDSRSYEPPSSTGSGSGSRSAATRQIDTTSDYSHAHITSGENSQNAVVQEEDAGFVISPEDRRKTTSLPPAYKPDWRNPDSKSVH